MAFCKFQIRACQRPSLYDQADSFQEFWWFNSHPLLPVAACQAPHRCMLYFFILTIFTSESARAWTKTSAWCWEFWGWRELESFLSNLELPRQSLEFYRPTYAESDSCLCEVEFMRICSESAPLNYWTVDFAGGLVPARWDHASPLELYPSASVWEYSRQVEWTVRLYSFDPFYKFIRVFIERSYF